MKIRDMEFDGSKLKKLLLKDNPWMGKCIIDTNHNKLTIFCPEYDCYLRHSKGPRQGYFWDVYGDDFMYKELALYALSKAPMPFTPYVKFTLKLNNR